MTVEPISLLVIALAIGYFALWIWALVKTGNNGQWGWFITIFLFSPILLFIYLLFGRKGPL